VYTSKDECGHVDQSGFDLTTLAMIYGHVHVHVHVSDRSALTYKHISGRRIRSCTSEFAGDNNSPIDTSAPAEASTTIDHQRVDQLADQLAEHEPTHGWVEIFA